MKGEAKGDLGREVVYQEEWACLPGNLIVPEEDQLGVQLG